MAKINFIPKPSTPPGVGASCLRKKFNRHSCQACADACPVNAIHLSSSNTLIDETACISCGQCLFACPNGSLQHLQSVSRFYNVDTLVAPFSALAPVTDELVMWHFEYGIRRAALNMDEHPAWALAIATLNVWLRKVNQPVWQIIPPETQAVNRSRRHLMHVAVEGVSSAQVTADPRKRRQYLYQVSEYDVSLALSHCVGCGACARVCSEEALQFKNSELEWSSERCTGCGSMYP